MPCYFLFNEHEFVDDSGESGGEGQSDNPCFPFVSRGTWGMVSHPMAIFKPPANVTTSCSLVQHVESCPSSVPCCVSSLGCMLERERSKEILQEEEKARLSGDASQILSSSR